MKKDKGSGAREYAGFLLYPMWRVSVVWRRCGADLFHPDFTFPALAHDHFAVDIRAEIEREFRRPATVAVPGSAAAAVARPQE